MKIHIYSIGACLLFLSGCNNEVVNPDNERVPISFSAEIPSLLVEEVQTRATDFPNSGSIAVVAANSALATPITSTDWSSGNVYLNHLAATVGDKNGTIYPVTFGSTQYWPFDPDKYLSFVSYSPATHSSLTHSATDLTVNITGKSYSFPDLLYTAPVGSFNKENIYNSERGRAYLGEFKHAMAKLVVKVIAVDKGNNEITSGSIIDDVKVTKLYVQTKVTEGTFSLITSPPAWGAFTSGSIFQTAYSFIAGATSLPYNKDATNYCYLLPGTEGNSQIGIEVKDKTLTSLFTKAMTDFMTGDAPPVPVTLEMGKATILTIKLQFTDTPTANGAIELKGELTNWDYKGESMITIE